jgi:hypothetical protein
MANENFTTYTEVDPNSHITVTTSRVTNAGIDRNEVCYIYKDCGIGHFSGDFEWLFELKTFDNAGDPNKDVWGMGLSNTIGSFDAQATHDLAIEFNDYNSSAWTYLVAKGVVYSSAIGLAYNTLYYCKMKRVGNITTVYFYSDSGRTTLVGSIAVTDANKISGRYLYILESNNAGVSRPSSDMYIQNLDLQEASAKTIAYSTDVLHKKLDIIVPNLAVTPTEKIANGTFENGTLNNWEFDNETGPPTVTTSDPHSGTYCCDVNKDTDLYNNVGDDDTGPLVSEITSFGFWYKNTGDLDSQMSVYFYDENIDDWTSFDTFNLPANTLSWTYFDLMPYLLIDASLDGTYVASHINRYQEIDFFDNNLSEGHSSHAFIDDVSLMTGGSSSGSCNIDAMFGLPSPLITYQIDVILQMLDILKSKSIDLIFKKTDMLSTYDIDFSITNSKPIPYVLDMDISKIDNAIEYGIDVRLGPITKTEHNYQFDTKFLLSILKAYNMDTRIVGKKTKIYPIEVDFKNRPLRTYNIDVNFAMKLINYLIVTNFITSGNKICPFDVCLKNATAEHTKDYSFDANIMVHGLLAYYLDCYWAISKPIDYFIDGEIQKTVKPTCGLDCKLVELTTRNTIKNSGGTLTFYPIEWKESQKCTPAIRDVPLGASQFIDTGTFTQGTRQIEFTFRATDTEKDIMEAIFAAKEQVMLWLYHQTGNYYWLYSGWLDEPRTEFEYVEQTDVDGITKLTRWWKITLMLNVTGFSYWNAKSYGVS